MANERQNTTLSEEEKKKIEEEEKIRVEARAKAEKEIKEEENKKELKGVGIGCLAVFVFIAIIFIGIGGCGENKKTEPSTEPSAKSETTPLTPEQKLESAYAGAVIQINKNIRDSTKYIGDLLQAKPNSLLWTEEEIMLLAFSTVVIEESYKQAKELEPPEKFETVYSLWLSALSKYAEAMPILRYGIDHSDADKINQSNDLILEGNKSYKQATEELEKLLQ